MDRRTCHRRRIQSSRVRQLGTTACHNTDQVVVRVRVLLLGRHFTILPLVQSARQTSTGQDPTMLHLHTATAVAAAMLAWRSTILTVVKAPDQDLAQTQDLAQVQTTGKDLSGRTKSVLHEGNHGDVAAAGSFTSSCIIPPLYISKPSARLSTRLRETYVYYTLMSIISKLALASTIVYSMMRL